MHASVAQRLLIAFHAQLFCLRVTEITPLSASTLSTNRSDGCAVAADALFAASGFRSEVRLHRRPWRSFHALSLSVPIAMTTFTDNSARFLTLGPPTLLLPHPIRVTIVECNISVRMSSGLFRLADSVTFALIVAVRISAAIFLGCTCDSLLISKRWLGSFYQLWSVRARPRPPPSMLLLLLLLLARVFAVLLVSVATRIVAVTVIRANISVTMLPVTRGLRTFLDNDRGCFSCVLTSGSRAIFYTGATLYDAVIRSFTSVSERRGDVYVRFRDQWG